MYLCCVLTFASELPKIELESYIANYAGRSRFERLYFIGRTSPVLCIEALKMAIAEAKSGCDVVRYSEAVKSLAQVAPNEPEATEDTEWIAQTTRKVSETTTRLTEELKMYRRNLVGESIRLGYIDLGKHYESIGKPSLALENYRQIQREGTTPLHLLDMHAMIVRVAFEAKEWSTVLNNLHKMHEIVSSMKDDDTERLSAIFVCQGIAYMNRSEWRDACNSFLAVTPKQDSMPYNEFASPNDVAVLGSLLALATMERDDLQTKLLGNQQFRTLLAMEPMLRKAIAAYVSGRYSTCLSILESSRADYLLDVHLSPSIGELYRQIRSKCIREYCKPFSTVTIRHLDELFRTTGTPVIDEIKALIVSGQLSARINTIDGIITSQPKPTSVDVLYCTVSRVSEFEDNLRSSLRQMGLVLSNLDCSPADRLSRPYAATAMAAILASSSGSGSLDRSSLVSVSNDVEPAAASQSVSSGDGESEDVEMSD
ncbi:hypothetical protein TD95_003657 [Thielaviopsis punctulata]|uniref:PCI domain-containing protein n=1 Tax=Thielaviopsis punctulata TaxID=72032 RepID=A0A0F4ZC03_9PEZI|nr:hypothetical protein TD95_003657 [Thielaviopsis punctulata]